MTCYEIVCAIVQTLSFVVLAIMIYSIKAKERADEQEAKRVADYESANWRYKTMEQVYKHEAEEYRHWLCFGLNYGCHTPEEMKSLINDLVTRIRRHMEAQ